MPIRGFLARNGWLIAVAVTYLYVFPHWPKVHSANELPRAYLVKAMAHEGRFVIDTGVRRWGTTVDVSKSDGHNYSNKAPGSSMLVLPPYKVIAAIAGEPSLTSTMWIARVFGGIIPALLFLALVYRFLARFVPDPAIRQLVCLAYALGSLAMTYSMLFFSHQLAAACIASAWIFGLEGAEQRNLRKLAAAGFFAGCAPLVDYQAVFAVVPIAVHVVWKLRGHGRAIGIAEIARAIGIATATAAIPIAILLAYHAICFGSPFRTGYDASESFAHFHQQGFLGITELRWEAFVGSFVRLDNGLLALAPWLALAIPGSFVLARGLHHVRGETRPVALADRWRARVELVAGTVFLTAACVLGVVTTHGTARTAILGVLLVAGAALVVIGACRVAPARSGDLGTALVGLAVIVIYTLFISSINFWRGGWSVGPRYITAMLPFVLPAIVVMLAFVRRKSPAAFGAVAGLILVGVTIYTLAAAVSPYWHEGFKHPLYDQVFRLLAEGRVAPNLGGVLGLEGVLGIAPLFALVAVTLALAIRRAAGTAALAIAIVVAVATMSLYGLAPHGGKQADDLFVRVRGVHS